MRKMIIAVCVLIAGASPAYAAPADDTITGHVCSEMTRAGMSDAYARSLEAIRDRVYPLVDSSEDSPTKNKIIQLPLDKTMPFSETTRKLEEIQTEPNGRTIPDKAMADVMSMIAVLQESVKRCNDSGGITGE